MSAFGPRGPYEVLISEAMMRESALRLDELLSHFYKRIEEQASKDYGAPVKIIHIERESISKPIIGERHKCYVAAVAALPAIVAELVDAESRGDSANDVGGLDLQARSVRSCDPVKIATAERTSVTVGSSPTDSREIIGGGPE